VSDILTRFTKVDCSLLVGNTAETWWLVKTLATEPIA